MKIKYLIVFLAPALLLVACQKNTKTAPKTTSTEQAAPAANAGGLSWAGDQDVVCDMKIDQSVEDTVHYNGKIYGFCSESCKSKFQENPVKYVVK